MILLLTHRFCGEIVIRWTHWQSISNPSGKCEIVTVMPYLWNGHRKELLEHEEEVEQRGIELGQAEGV